MILEAIVLGLIQGLTEFIPISSSAHLILVPWLFGWNDPALNSLSFDVALHLGTLVAVLWFFAADWIRLAKAFLASLVERRIGADPDRKLAWLIGLGCIPGAIAGVLGESAIETWFHQPGIPLAPLAEFVIAIVMTLLALFLFMADQLARHERPLESLGIRETVWIGLAQALAIIPGVSRSGATITAGLALGLRREAAARFSFLLGAPIIAGAGLKTLWNLVGAFRGGTGISASEWILFPIGFVVAAVSGYFCIKFLLRFLQSHSARVFAYYRWLLALAIIAVAFFRG